MASHPSRQQQLRELCELQRVQLVGHWRVISRQAQRTDHAIKVYRKAGRWITLFAPWVIRWLFKRR
jgi:hypothetical protein